MKRRGSKDPSHRWIRRLSPLVVLLAVPARGECHRLDEYLQAALIGIEPGRVAVELVLTPGAAVAPTVLASIDTDGDTRMSPSEIEAYGRAIVSGLSLRIDGRRSPIVLTRAEAASWNEIRDGVGGIRVETIADADISTSGRHLVSFENHHEAAAAVYQVNALVPRSRSVVITAQRRDSLQRRIDIDVEVTSPYAVFWWALPIALLAATVVGRRLMQRGPVASRRPSGSRSPQEAQAFG